MKKEIIDSIRRELLKVYLDDQKEKVMLIRNNSAYDFYLKGGDEKNEI